MPNLVGRQSELAALASLLEDVEKGESAVAVLSGEAGIGKTALIGAMLSLSREHGFQALSGRAVELERDLPFAVVANAFENRIDAPSTDSVDDALLSLAPIVFPSLAPLSKQDQKRAGPDERHRLLRTMQSLLEKMADERPLLFALDDLHWADPASIDLVCHLLYRRMKSPCLLLFASRLQQTEPRLCTAFDEAERHRRTLRIELTPLSAADAEQLLGEKIDPSLRGEIYRESGGNPLYLEQLAGAARTGAIAPKQAAESSQLNVPPAVKAAIGGELEILSPGARTLLEGAALLGEPFDPELAAETAGITRAEALHALDETLDVGLVLPAGAPRHFRFRHPIVRRAVQQSIALGWRFAAHGRAADALLARGAPAAVRAPHIEQAAHVGNQAAAETLALAGEEAAPSSPASAAHWFGAAIGLLPKCDETLERRLELLLRQATALGSAGEVEESRRALGDFLAFAPQEPSETRTQATLFAAILDELLGRQGVGRQLLLDQLRRLPDPEGKEAAKLKCELAFTTFFDADWNAMRQWAGEALSAKCEGMVRTGALAAVGLADLGLGHPGGMRRSVRDAAELFDSLSDAEVAAHDPGIGIWLGWAEVCSECFDDAIRHLERSISISRSIGQRHLTVGLFAVQGQALALKGDGRGLAAAAEAATEAALLTSSDLYLSWAMTLQCQASAWNGDLYAALRFGERGLGAASTSSTPQSDLARVQLASTLLESGEVRRCRELLTLSDGEPNLPPFPLFESFCLELLVRSELGLGEIDRASDLAERALQAALGLGLRLPLAQARRARALVLAAQDKHEASASEARASREAAERVHADVEAARSHVLEATALARIGERQTGINGLEAARRQLIAHGALRYGDEAARQLRKLGRVVPDAVNGAVLRSDTLGLTEREMEVIERLVSGKTNREIAAELYLSVRTVDRHVSRIFSKLGVSSRAAAASTYERHRASLGSAQRVKPG